MSVRRRLLAAFIGGSAIAAVTGLLVSGPATAAPATTAATASSASTILQSFNPGDIISDAVMYNSSSMTVAQIQSFLNSQQPSCASGYTCLKNYRANSQTMAANLMCGTYAGASNESAATIVYKVAKACRINPQVLLVTMQKEQGLVTGVDLSWYPNAYRSATGLGCPDDAPCDPAKYGFFNQVYGAGYWLIRYTTPPGTTGPGWSDFDRYPVGKTSSILYNPDPTCGSRSVKIANKATESLYVYTPYTPNAAALAAGYGAGDDCSAYGNRNFFLYFTQWFGSTHLTVTGAISTYWNAHGGASGALGAATANAVTSTANGGGTFQTFQHGTVYSSKAGTFAITGAVLTEYNRRGGVSGSLQWPTADQRTLTANGGGVVQQFGSGEIDSSPAGTFAVRGQLLVAYQGLGSAAGSLGWPTDGASTLGTGWVQHFTKGTDYFQDATGGFGVPASLDAGYVARKGPTGPLGWPVKSSASRTAAGIVGTVQSFQSGDMYSSKVGTAAVLGAVRSVFTASADTFDSLGWPTADATTSTAGGGGTVQVFSGGRLYIPNGQPAVAVTGAILTRYIARGEESGFMGWPTSQQLQVAAHGTTMAVQTFANGAAYLSGGSVTTVTGVIYARYTALGGPAGAIGWATGPAVSRSAAGGGWVQPFTGGTIYYSSTSQQAWPVTGSMLVLYQKRGEAGGAFGWPAGSAASVTAHGSTRTYQAFGTGSFTQSGSTITTVNGGLYRAYAAAGGPTGDVGWVTGGAHQTSLGGGGWTQTFSGATIFYCSKTGKAYPVAGAVLHLYTQRGTAGSSLGWPTAAAAPLVADGVTGTTQTFQGGSVYVDGTTANSVTGQLYVKYVADQAAAGPLGWVADIARHTSAAGGGWTQRFAHGELFYSTVSNRSSPVSGAILTAYLARSGPAGGLGWPIEDPQVSGTTTTQRFQHGTVTDANGTVTVH